MATIARSVTISAPVETVFDAIAHVENFSRAVPAVHSVEFLSTTQRGVGTRFEETRETNGRVGKTVLEVTEYVENERVRIVSDAGGALWDTLFTTMGTADGTELMMVMDARPHTILARITTPMVKGLVAKGIDADLSAVKSYCEGPVGSGEGHPSGE